MTESKTPMYCDAYGQPTTVENDKRMMWYSSRCTYWTDNWGKLARTGPGIPCCPKCGSVGYESAWDQFDRSSKRYDEKAAEGYYVFLQEVKEKCLGANVSVQKAFDEWRKDAKRQLDRSISKLVDEHKEQ